MSKSKSPALSRFQADMHRLLTIVLQREIDDPMLVGISLTRFEITDANGEAIAYVHSMLKMDGEEAVKRLNRLKPHIMHLLRKAMPKKRLPSLDFRWDHALDETYKVMDTMDTLKHS